MFSLLVSIFTSQHPNKYWLQVLILLLFIFVAVYWYNRNYTVKKEGFSQDSRFSLKINDGIYDDFYVKIYDTLMQPKARSNYEITQIVEKTKPTNQSVFLDIGSGTGDSVHLLNDIGYNAFGVELSNAMVQQSLKKYPDISVKPGDAMEPMLYEPNTFTHILCTGMTIYQMTDKVAFFRNCKSWLMPGGHLVLNLVDRTGFDTIVPCGKPALLKNPQQFAEKRITDTIIDFIDFEYKAGYQFKDNKATFKETFTDGLTQNVRQNEMTLYMEDTKNIIAAVLGSGFRKVGEKDMADFNGDSKNYLYFFQKV